MLKSDNQIFILEAPRATQSHLQVSVTAFFSSEPSVLMH